MKYFCLIILVLATTSCEFGSKKAEVVQQEAPETIASYVDYRVEAINEKSGPCKQDSLSVKCADFSIEYPVITGRINDTALANINESIRSTIFDYAYVTEKPESFRALITELSTEYSSILKEFPNYRASWSMEITSDIIYQDSSFISVATSIYSYTGGAHPNSYQVYRSYDLNSGEPITLADVLNPSFENELNQAAEIEFRMLKEIPPSQDLKDRGYFFETGNFTLNDNFAIINKSLVFYFNTYEISSYANGPTELELKLTDYVNLVNEKGVLNGLKN